jgi:hypothetical protein
MHPWFDPFKTIEVANYPNQGDCHSCGGSIVALANEILDVSKLMCDADATSK